MKAKKSKKAYDPTGYIIYKGPSLIDGKPIVVILLTSESDNSKTGDMMQTYILRANVNPITAAKTGSDYSICGNCIHRPTLTKKNGQAKCYVTLIHGPRSVYATYRRNRYPFADAAKVAELVKGRKVRFGSYGDPAAAPIEIFQNIKNNCVQTTGYTHRWQDPEFNMDWQNLVMLSIDNYNEQQKADLLGLRYFRVSNGNEQLLPGEISCPASEEGGRKTTCENCCLCSGSGIKAKNIVIADHGPGWEARSLEIIVKEFFSLNPIN